MAKPIATKKQSKTLEKLDKKIGKLREEETKLMKDRDSLKITGDEYIKKIAVVEVELLSLVNSRIKLLEEIAKNLF